MQTLEISTYKVAQVILMARERNRAEGELRSFIEAMTEEEQASLVAVMWVGRGSFEPEELMDAYRTAFEEATTPTVEYLLGSPHLSDHLENGLDALGIDPSEDEDDLIRGG